MTRAVGRQRSHEAIHLIVAHHDTDPRISIALARKRQRRSLAGWYVQLAESGRVVRTGDYGRHATEDDALSSIMECYPGYKWEIYRD